MILSPLNAELNPICHLLALLGAHHILHVSRIRVNCLTCFERYAVHHQELKNCNCSLWFYIHLWLSATVMAEPSQWPTTINVRKTGRQFFLWDLYYDAQIHEHQVKFIHTCVCVCTYTHTSSYKNCRHLCNISLNLCFVIIYYDYH